MTYGKARNALLTALEDRRTDAHEAKILCEALVALENAAAAHLSTSIHLGEFTALSPEMQREYRAAMELPRRGPR